MKNLHTVDVIAVVLLIIGGLNWLLIGLFDVDVVSSIFGMVIARIIFVLVGLAAVWRIICWCKCGKKAR